MQPPDSPHVLLVGVEPFGEEIARQAALLGWSTQTSTELEDSLAAVERLSTEDAVIVLEHKHQIATPVLVAALQSEVGYVGALGSRRMQAARGRSLQAAGVTDEQIAA